jgi:hypothetical protein
MKAKEIINEIGVGKIPGLDEPLQGFGGGGAGGGIPAALGTAATVAPAARIKSIKPDQPLNPPGQNVWRSGQTGAPMRSPGDKAQNIDDFIMTSRANIAGKPNTMTPAELRKYFEPPPAPGERLAVAAVPVAAGAAGVGMYAAGSDKGDKPASGQSTPQAPVRNPNMTQQMQDRLGIPLNSQGRTASGATPAPAARPATTAPAARPAGPQQGVVGSELARLSGGEFASRADRLNQARVDAILGSGYKAGSAAANRALRDYYKANPPESDAQRQELAQKIFNQNMERARQQAEKDLIRNYPGLRTEPAGSDNSTVTVPEDKNQLMRLMKLSGQR